MIKIFEEFKGKSIPYLDWTFYLHEKDLKECKELYSISDEYQILAVDICGSIVTIKNNYIVKIDHEDSAPENDYEITNELDKLKILIQRLIGLEDYTDSEDLISLKRIKKELKECKKIAPKKMKDDFQDIIEDIETEIEYF